MRPFITVARLSDRTVKGKRSCIAPGTLTIASSPSQVLQIQPFFESFWMYPARSPLEYVYVSAITVHAAMSRAGRPTTAPRMSQGQRRRPRRGGVGASSAASCCPSSLMALLRDRCSAPHALSRNYALGAHAVGGVSLDFATDPDPLPRAVRRS